MSKILEFPAQPEIIQHRIIDAGVVDIIMTELEKALIEANSKGVIGYALQPCLDVAKQELERATIVVTETEVE